VIEASPAGRADPTRAACDALRPEWDRVGLLASCAGHLRRGEPLPNALRDSLAASQSAVGALRVGTPWRELSAHHHLEGLDQDILACTLAPDAEPTLGWTFQELQGGTATPYPSPALIRELLALDGAEAGELHRRLDASAPLQRSGLVEAPGGWAPFEPLRPTARARELLLGWEQTPMAPPGATLLPVPPGIDLDALIVPPHHKRALREFVAMVRLRDRVGEQWGVLPGGGPVALMAGPSGTGKTYAATVIAGMLGWRLYRVDLGMLVSKWLGETEKNINRLFDAASGREMVLLFDEADALFGKRGQIREARDRYANMEVGHLLSRLELHRGPAILTTNMREHLDPAFARRIHLVLELPLPDVAARAALWSRYLPPTAPIAAEVDMALLAGAVRLTGAQIRNACLYAAVLAMDAGRSIDLAALARGVWVELGKDGRELLDERLGALAAHLEREDVR
jgi:ATPase family associated with various cellular activities (AAA)